MAWHNEITVSHTRLQYYNFNLCLVCLTGLFGCRWHRYKQSTDATKKKDLGCFAFLVITLLYMLFFLLFWLTMENYANWLNVYFYDIVGTWHRYYKMMFIATCFVFTYVAFIMVLALCHASQGFEIYMHWLHKAVMVLTVAGCIGGTIALNSVWPSCWSVFSLWLTVMAPFLHVVAVSIMTLLTWLIAAQWNKLYTYSSKILWISVYAAVMLGLYIAPVFFNSPCIIESGDLPQRPGVIGHKGASAIAPENTLISFQLAANYTSFGLETDLGISYDGVPFLLHDGKLRRTTNVEVVFPERASNCSCSFNMDELQQLDAGSWFIKVDPQGQMSKAPSWARAKYPEQTIPTLAQLLQLVKAKNENLMFDIKFDAGREHPHYHDYIDIIIKTILDSGVPQHKIWWLLSENAAFHLTKKPNFTYVMPGGQHEIADLQSLDVHVINAQHSMLTLSDIEFYKHHNISVNIYLVNTKWLYSLYWCAGVDSVTSDVSHVLTAVTAPGWRLSPTEFKVMWITTDVLSLLLVIIMFGVQRMRYSNQSFQPESMTFEAARIRMNRMKNNRNMKEKLLRMADVIQEVDGAGPEEGGIMGNCIITPTPAMEQRFSHTSTSSGPDLGNVDNRYSDVSGISEALASFSPSNRHSGISGLSSLSGVVTIETNPDSRSFSDGEYRLSQPSGMHDDIFA